jgi:hypothetical protein
VEVKLGICMPSCKEEEGVKDGFLMMFVLSWKESFKDRNDALQNQLWIVAKLTTAETHTCKISSKSHAASRFKPETLLVNLQIASRPNVGIIRKLKHAMVRRVPIKLGTKNIPIVKLSNSCRTTGKEKPDEMDQETLKDTQLKLMHQVYNKQHESVETRASKSGVECILKVLSDTIQRDESVMYILWLEQVILL